MLCYKIKVSRKNVHSIQAWHFSLAKRKHFSNVSSWSLISVFSCHKNFLLIGQCWDTDDSSQKYNLSQQILKCEVQHSFPKLTLLAPVSSITDITKWFSQNTVANCTEGESIECKTLHLSIVSDPIKAPSGFPASVPCFHFVILVSVSGPSWQLASKYVLIVPSSLSSGNHFKCQFEFVISP